MKGEFFALCRKYILSVYMAVIDISTSVKKPMKGCVPMPVIVSSQEVVVNVENREVPISNPQKLLWPDAGVTKMDYIRYLLLISPYLLAYTRNRPLTMIRYPHGTDGKSFFQKETPVHAPSWIPQVPVDGKSRILLNDAATLVWVAGQAALELHTPFNTYDQEDYPQEIVLDLDPMDTENFALVKEVACKTKEVLDSFGLISVPKTSGATGLQIYVPLEPKYTYEETRLINEFIAQYIAAGNPGQVTLERTVNKRGKLLYFDYLQLWRGRTMPVPYSVRARPLATVSAPLTWDEVAGKASPMDFTVLTMPARIENKGDLFSAVSTTKVRQNLDEILSFIKKNYT